MKNNLKVIRLKKGIQQQKMAEKLGLSLWHYNKIENGGKGLTSEIAIKVSKELNVTLDEIFFGNDLSYKDKKELSY